MTPRRNVFVGRDRELEELRESLDALEAGRGGAVFIVGAPGVGKSSLLEMILAEEGTRHLTVTRSRAWPFDAGLAYAPIIQALGAWLRDVGPVRRADLTNGLPELSRLFGDLGLPQPPRLGDAALEKTRLFESVARLIERQSSSAPTLLAVDDVHLADASTSDLLQYLVRRLVDVPWLLLGTARTPGFVGRGSEVIVQAELSGDARTIALDPFDEATSRAFIERSLEGEVDDELAASLYLRSEGVPFFLSTLLDSVIDGGQLVRIAGRWRIARGRQQSVPETARKMVLEIFRCLDQPERTVLDHLSVGGPDVGLTTLQAVCRIDREGLVGSLRELLQRGLVIESCRRDGELTYSLAVPLAQEVLHEQLSQAERRAIHRRFLTGTTGASPAALARHVRGCGPDIDDPESAIDILLSAAVEARARYAHDEAARWYGAALMLCRSRGIRGRLPDILHSLGDAWRASRESAAAIEAWSEALDLCDACDDREGAAALRAKMSLELWHVGRIEKSIATLREGIAALEPDGPSLALARLYEASFVQAWRLGDTDWIREKSSALSTWPEDRRFPFQLAMARANQRLAAGDLIGAASAAAHAREKAQCTAEKLHAGRFRLLLAMASGRVDEATLRDYRDLSIEAGVPSLEVPYGIIRGLQALFGGDLRAASVHFEEATIEADLHRSARLRAGASGFLATAQALRGRFADAEKTLAAARDLVEVRHRDTHQRSTYDMARAALAIERGDKQSALTVAAETSAPGDPLFLEEHIRAEAWLIAGDFDRAGEVASSVMARYAGIDHAVAGGERVLGLVHIARGQANRARDRLESALGGFERGEMTFFAARVRLEIAELEGTSKAKAIRDARRALEVFEGADARRWQERARAVLRRHGELTARPHAASTERPLSERELEVARLAARGLTNARIGRELFISPHTVATHMKRILAKAAVSNRPALAAWLRESGLDDSQ